MTDGLGREISVGDRIAWARGGGSSSLWFYEAHVVSFSDTMVRIMGDQGRKNTIQPNRCVIVEAI